jgi:RimJ/RimL family protein N-acetyltransferase
MASRTKVSANRLHIGGDANIGSLDWRAGLPVLETPAVTLREAAGQDAGPLLQLLSAPDACRFGLDDINEESIEHLVNRVRDDRSKGVSFMYVALGASGQLVGAARARALDPVFDAAEWEGTLLPSVRGTTVMLDAARLVGSFAFHTVGVRRLESRVSLQDGRGNGALRKLGAVAEGVLRGSLRHGRRREDQVLWTLLREDWTMRWASTAPQAGCS